MRGWTALLQRHHRGAFLKWETAVVQNEDLIPDKQGKFWSFGNLDLNHSAVHNKREMMNQGVETELDRETDHIFLFLSQDELGRSSSGGKMEILKDFRQFYQGEKLTLLSI
jgi:hypothetical protein